MGGHVVVSGARLSAQPYNAVQRVSCVLSMIVEVLGLQRQLSALAVTLPKVRFIQPTTRCT